MERKLKVLVIDCSDFSRYPPGGIKYFLRNILPPMSREAEIALIGLTTDVNEKIGRWSKRQIRDKVFPFMPVYYVREASSHKKPKIPVRIGITAGIILNKRRIPERFDVLYIHYPELVLPFLLPKKKIPIVFHLHGRIKEAALNSRYKWLRCNLVASAFYKLNVYVLRNSDKVLTISEDGLQLCSNILPGRRKFFHVVPACVNTQIFSPRNKLEMRKKHGFSKDDKIVIFVGRIERLKRPDILISAMSIVKERISNVKLLIAGSGSEKSSLELKAQELGVETHFFGEVEHDSLLPELLNCADVFAFTSGSGEGFPSAILEALACGLPVVSTNVGDIKKVIIDGITGFLVDRPDPNIIASCLIKAVNLSPAMSGKCVNTAKLYSSEVIAKSVIDHLKEVVYANRN